jgi:hypothetical protein
MGVTPFDSATDVHLMNRTSGIWIAIEETKLSSGTVTTHRLRELKPPALVTAD